MTDQSDMPVSQAGDSTVPLVPDHGYAQPEVPPLEDAWPDFSYDDPARTALFDASEPTVEVGSAASATGSYAGTAPLPSADPGWAGQYVPQPTTPLPPMNPQPGATYQQPTYQQPPAPSAYQPQSAYQPLPTHAALPPYQAGQDPEPSMYAAYQPYQTPAPVPYAYPMAAPVGLEHPNAVASLVLGIAGLFVLPILAPVAWFVAGRGRREMRQYPGRWAPSGSLTAGFVLGVIGTLLWGALTALLVLFVVLASASFGA